MGSLFSKPKMPEPTPPATMPDADDPLALRARRRKVASTAGESSSAQTRLAPVPGTIGREFSRTTLGAK